MWRKVNVIWEIIVIASLPFNHCFNFSLQYNLLHEDLFPEPFKCVDSEKTSFDFRLN